MVVSLMKILYVQQHGLVRRQEGVLSIIIYNLYKMQVDSGLASLFLRFIRPALQVFVGLGQFLEEIGHAGGGLLGAFGLLGGGEPPCGGRNDEVIIRAFEQHAAVAFAVPFEVEAVSEVFGWFFPAFIHRHGFRHGHVKDPDFARGGEVADAAALVAVEGVKVRVGNELERVGESEEAAGQVRPGIALEFEQDWVSPASYPEFAAHEAFDAVVNLAAHHAVM